MIEAFEKTARRTPEQVFFRFTETDGAVEAVTYRQARLRAVALLEHLQRVLGLEEGRFVACDLDNSPAFVYLLLACQYGGIALVTLNHRLTSDEKAERVESVRDQDPRGRCPVLAEEDVVEAVRAAGDAESADELLHRADSLGGVAARNHSPIIMFTSGTTGKAKAAVLTAESLCGSAEAYNRAFGCDRSTIWQATLPLYHVGGLQIAVRSMLNGTAFLLYRRFDAKRVLEDAGDYRATNISVVDKTLRDLMQEATANTHDTNQEFTRLAVLRAYRCVLLGGAAPNPVTLEQARKAGIRVYSSYGMTETCSLVAACPIDREDGVPLTLLPGYRACIVQPDEDGNGQLGVRGPGVFGGYLHARALFTADGYFLTGDTARMDNDRIIVAERTQDMFVSGGENVYPEEIRKRILKVPGVTDAYVFGARDATWGRRPVAFVEMANANVLPETAAQLSDEVQISLQQRLAKIYRPDRLFVVNGLPRTGIGKVDRAALEALDARSLDVREVHVHRIRQPFAEPVRTAKEVLRGRESLLVEVVDAAGRVGTGEDAAFSTDWYLPETIDDDLGFLERQGIPCILRQAYLQPDAVYGALAMLPGAQEHLMAVSALETALWDLYGKITQRTIAELIGARTRWDVRGREFTLPTGCVPGGAVIGIMSTAQTVAAAKQATENGYLRIKLKIRPGSDVERVAAVREALPDTILMLDANQSYTDEQLPVLRQLDEYRCAGIEEPLDPHHVPKVGPKDLFARLARLQKSLGTPVFLDESVVTPADAERALTYPDLRGFVMKIGKWGGIMPASDFYWKAREHGATIWMGGMFDTGISKRLHAAFSLLPGVTIPGDINDTARYFPHDVTTPPLVLESGCLQVNPPRAPYGVGCAIDHAEMESVLLESRTYRRGCLPFVRHAGE